MPDGRSCPDGVTTRSLYAVWIRLRAEAGLDGVRIHDRRYSFASQGVMSGECLPTVGRLIGHRQRATTAIFAHPDFRAGCAGCRRSCRRPRR